MESSASPFVYKCRVYYEDTDAGGIVYYANYLKFCERARTEWLRPLGIQAQSELLKSGRGFVVRSIKGSYDKPARLDDELSVGVELLKMRHASLVLLQTICNQSHEKIFELECTLVFVDFKTGLPCGMPAVLLDFFKKAGGEQVPAARK